MKEKVDAVTLEERQDANKERAKMRKNNKIRHPTGERQDSEQIEELRERERIDGEMGVNIKLGGDDLDCEESLEKKVIMGECEGENVDKMRNRLEISQKD